MNLLGKIKEKKALVGVIGLGYVGLPLVLRFTEVGFRVLGFDTDPQKVERLNRGESYIKYIPSSRLAELIKPGNGRPFEATGDMGRLGEPDVLIICVPTPLTRKREPDLRYVEDTARLIAVTLRPGQLVSLESTTYPGTTQELMLPILEKKGLEAGQDFYLVFSPEREDPGNAHYEVRTIPKVVGGITPACLEHGVALYGQVVEKVVPVSSTQAAELSKLLENIYRAVNIALVNELKMLCLRMGLDIFEVIEASKTKPFGFQAFYPGPGLGGHCIPIDPFYLTWKAREYDFSTRFIELAGEINTAMPYFVVQRLAQALGRQGKPLQGAKILLLGLAYKRDVDDPRESPALKIMQLLKGEGAEVSYNDPFIPQYQGGRHYPGLIISSSPLTDQVLGDADCVLLVTDHSSYDYDWIASRAKLVVDTRNAFKGVRGGHIVQA